MKALIIILALLSSSAQAGTQQESIGVTVNGFGSWEEAYEDARKKLGMLGSIYQPKKVGIGNGDRRECTASSA